MDFYHNESRLLGVDSLKLSFEETAEILRQLTSGFETGIFPPPPVETFSLAEGPGFIERLPSPRSRVNPSWFLESFEKLRTRRRDDHSNVQDFELLDFATRQSISSTESACYGFGAGWHGK